MRKKRAGARLAARAKVIVFGFVAFEIRRQELIDGDGRHSHASNAANLEDSEIEGVEDDGGND